MNSLATTEALSVRSDKASVVYTIYCHTHIESGRRYIGQTVKTLKQRWNQHVYKARVTSSRGCSKFWNAIRMYGRDAFSHQVLEVCVTSEEANEAEEAWIYSFSTRHSEFGFNLARGGSHTPHPIKNPWDRPGFREKNITASKAGLNTKESRARRSVASTKLWSDPEQKKKLSDAVTESHSRSEVKARLSAAQSGKVLSEEHKAKISQNNAMRDPEIRAKAAARTKKAMEDSTIRAKCATNLGKKTSEETKARISAAAIGRRLPPEWRANMSAGLRRAHGQDSDTHWKCKIHGYIPHSQCKQEKTSFGVRYRCKACKNGAVRKRNQKRSREIHSGLE